MSTRTARLVNEIVIVPWICPQPAAGKRRPGAIGCGERGRPREETQREAQRERRAGRHVLVQVRTGGRPHLSVRASHRGDADEELQVRRAHTMSKARTSTDKLASDKGCVDMWSRSRAVATHNAVTHAPVSGRKSPWSTVPRCLRVKAHRLLRECVAKANVGAAR